MRKLTTDINLKEAETCRDSSVVAKMNLEAKIRKGGQ